MRRASSRPGITSMGNPSTSSARRRKVPEFFATRSALVPTTRTASAACREALGEALQRLQRALLGLLVERSLGCESGGEAHRLLERIEGIDLVAVDAADG
jgi:hypothetical protein